MIKKLLTFCALCVGIVYAANAQQDPLYSLWLNNPMAINPAYTGLNNNFNVMAGFRKQWAGFDGAPTTESLTAHTSIADNRMGVGFVAVRDQIGEVTNTQFTGTFAYKIKLDESNVLSFGMQAGIMNYSSGNISLYQNPDPVFNKVSQIKPMIGAGVILKSEKYLFGLSVPRLLNSTFNVQGSNFTVYQQHYYLFASYIIPLTERILFKPGVLLKDVKGAPVSADVNLNLNFDRLYTVGVFTRNLNTYGILAQINFLQYYRLSYALEIPTGNSVGTHFTTNEINLGIKLAQFGFQDRSTTNW